MKHLSRTAFAACALFAIKLQASPTVINFNSDPDNSYFVGSVTSQGFVFTPGANSNMGTMSNFDGEGQTDGSIYLGSWSNDSDATLLSFQATDSSLFSLQSFDFDNAYASGGSRTNSLTITGTYQNATTTSETFSNLTNVLGFEELDLNSSFQGLTNVSVTADGETNTRALFDNFTVNGSAAAPDSGATVAMFGTALLCLAALRRKFASA